jgi:hypothetical protein
MKGDESSSPYPSLVPALEGVSLSGDLNGESSPIFLSAYMLRVLLHRGGLNAPPIITQTNVYIPLSAIVDNLVSVDFDVSPQQ